MPISRHKAVGGPPKTTINNPSQSKKKKSLRRKANRLPKHRTRKHHKRRCTHRPHRSRKHTRKHHKHTRKHHKHTRKRTRKHHRPHRSRKRKHKHKRKKRQYGGDKDEEKWKAKFLKSIKDPAISASVKKWGTTSKSKSLSDLYKEVKSGDSQVEFTDEGPKRIINVVQMGIYPSEQLTKQLKERKHYSPDDLTTPIKERDMLLSEKIQGTETPEAAALRGITEELGASHKITLLATPIFNKENKTTSYSYPNLPSIYRYFLGKAIVKGLPNPKTHPTFKTTEYNIDGSQKRIIEWGWEDVKPRNAII